MKKKIMLFLLAVFLGFALLISAICFFVPKKNQNSRENPTEQQKTEDTAEQTEKEKREKYHFTNLEYIYYINSENETDFEEQAAEYVEKNYKNNKGLTISSEEVYDVAKSMYRKADFTHQSITMATHLNPRWFVLADFYGGRKNVKDLSGWEGDTTTNATDMQPSIGMDDYLADLDSVNIVKRMTSNTQSYTQAMNSYFNDLQSSPNLREKEFKQNVDLNEVKSTIFESLVPVYERSSEEQSMEYLKEHEKYNSSYLFIESLEKEEMQYKKDE